MIIIIIYNMVAGSITTDKLNGFVLDQKVRSLSANQKPLTGHSNIRFCQTQCSSTKINIDEKCIKLII